MRKAIFISVALAIIAFTTNLLKKSNVEGCDSELTVDAVEALSGCESDDGYPMDRYCIYSPGSTCYSGDFAAKDCISNLV